MERPKLDVVFEGGGARGLALNGAVAELEKHGFSWGRLVGTSAGAITATLSALGYGAQELREVGLARLPSGASRMTQFLTLPSGFTDAELEGSVIGRVFAKADLPLVPRSAEQRVENFVMRALLRVDSFAHVFSFVERGGLYSADGFLTWLAERLEAKGVGTSKMTMAELHAHTGVDLSLIASDTRTQELVVLNHRTAPALPIVYAVRMSMSIPFVWPEVVWQATWGRYRGRDVTGHTFVDGGLVSNFALRFLVSDEAWIVEVMGGPPDPERRVLGLTLDGSLPVPGAPAPTPTRVLHSKTLDRIERVFETALDGSDALEKDNYRALVCALPTGGYGTLEFAMSAERIEALMACAGQAVDRWLAARERSFPKVAEAQRLLAVRPRVSVPPSAFG